jgi:hypothetical protein
MARAILLTTVTFAFAAAPGVALAQGGSTHVPSTNPVANQYSEMVPTAGGGTPSGGIGTGGTGPAGRGGTSHRGGTTHRGSPSGGGASGGGGGATTIPAAVVKQLNHAGTAGKATAALDQATASTVPRARHHVRRAKPNINGPTSAAASQVIKAVTGSSGGGGLGLLLPLILGVSLVCASLAGILRRRGAG